MQDARPVRTVRRGPRGGVLAIALVGGALALGACASSSGGSGAAEKPAKPAANVSRPPPVGSPLSKIQVGMSDAEVRKALGDPDKANAYMTGKGFIPFYYGGDTTRTDWIYSGQGRIVFSRNQWSGALKVIEVHYDPSL